MIDLVVFDLDGTLIDSHADIYRCVEMAFAACGLPDVTAFDVASLMGAPLDVYHARFRPPVSYEVFLKTYRSLYDVHGLETTRPYSGVEAMLSALQGTPLAVASTKPTRRVVQHVEAFGLDRYFDHLQGCDGPPYKPDPAVLLRVLRQLRARPSHTWMVGDLVSDVRAGRAAGMRTLAVTYAGTSREDHLAAGADEVVDGVAEVRERLDELRA